MYYDFKTKPQPRPLAVKLPCHIRYNYGPIEYSIQGKGYPILILYSGNLK